MVKLKLKQDFEADKARVQSLATLVSDSLTDLIPWLLVDLIDVTLPCEDANSKLVEVVVI